MYIFILFGYLIILLIFDSIVKQYKEMKDRNRISPNQLPTAEDLAQRLSRGLKVLKLYLYIYHEKP